MQGIAALGYEIEEIPLVPKGGIQEYEHAANLLAEFGRNGDTYIVHAAEGETMVPMEVLENNPRLKNMLFAQMEEMGIEPERYIVGNELNSINPVTGQAEFFFKNIFKKAKKAVKKVAKVAKKVAPVVLPIVAPFLLPAMPLAFATGIGSLAGNLIGGQDFKTALKGAVITGGLAGLGNMAFGGSEGFGSGSFFGSRAAPAQGLGTFNFQQAITPVNPLSQAGQTQLAALRAQAAQQAGGTGIDFTGQEIKYPDSQNLSTRGGDERSLFEKTKDKFAETFSPSRESIQATPKELASEAANIAKGEIAQTKAVNEALIAEGFPAADIDVAAIQKAAREQAAARTAPTFLEKFGPATALGTVGAVAADAATGGAILGVFTDTDEDGLDDATGYTSAEYQEMFPNAFFGDDFYGDNPYYQNRVTVAQGGEIVGPGTPTSDSIPALLSDGEFVMNAAAVRGAGGGDRKQGAKKMYAMMRDFERRA